MRLVFGIELNDYEISVVWQMVGTTEGKVFRGGVPNGAVGEL